jgi:hypothetical protein
LGKLKAGESGYCSFVGLNQIWVFFAGEENLEAAGEPTQASCFRIPVHFDVGVSIPEMAVVAG